MHSTSLRSFELALIHYLLVRTALQKQAIGEQVVTKHIRGRYCQATARLGLRRLKSVHRLQYEREHKMRFGIEWIRYERRSEELFRSIKVSKDRGEIRRCVQRERVLRRQRKCSA